STFPAGSAYPLCSGFPSSVFGCLNDSIASYNPAGGGTDGIGLWYNLVGVHSNLFMALSGHVRNPKPGNYPSVPSYNGVGYVDFPSVSALPAGTKITIGNSGTHHISVQTYDSTRGTWVKSAVYVTTP